MQERCRPLDTYVAGEHAATTVFVYVYVNAALGVPYYVGITNNPVVRAAAHWYRKGRPKTDMFVALACEDRDSALYAEQQWINAMRPILQNINNPMAKPLAKPAMTIIRRMVH